MTKVYDFSVFDIREHNYVFAEMTEAEIAEKKRVYEENQKNKAAAKSAVDPVVNTAASADEKKDIADAPKAAKPVFKPKTKPAVPPPASE
jgi:hypothetical protein